MHLLNSVVLLVKVLVCVCQSSTMIMDVIEVIHNHNVTFSCHVPSLESVTIWTFLHGPTGSAALSFHDGTCTMSPSDSFLNDSVKYSYTCNSTVHQVTLHYFNFYDDFNNILTCRDGSQSERFISSWIIKSRYNDGTCRYCEPTIPFNVIDVIEGENITFICRVSSDVSYVNWNMNIESNRAAMGEMKGQCTTQLDTFLENTIEYNYTCNKTVYQVTKFNVQRSEHNDMYMCTSPSQLEGQGSNWILNVKAKAVVISFQMNELSYKAVTVNEGSTVGIKCVADGIPMPTIMLNNSFTTLISNTSYTIKYTLTNATYEDIDTYTCTAQNEISREIKSFDLFVNCPPRMSTASNREIQSGIGEKIEITCDVFSYPLPSFTWLQLVSNRWKLIQNTEKMSVESSDLQSTLTINKIATEDYTSYKVVVENSVDNMEEVYTLSHNGSPDAPTQLRYYEDLSTSTSLKLAWNPGYNGGSAQIFYIKYKTSDESFWNYMTVPDNGEQTQIFSLNGLKDNTHYYVLIFASNVRGNSTESQLLIAKTNEIEHPESDNLGPVIGGIVGGFVVLVVTAFIAGFFISRKLASSEGCLAETSPSQKQSDEGIANVSSTVTHFDNIGSENEYEMIKQGNSPPYSTLQPDNNLAQDDSSRDDTYENPN